MAQFPFIRVRQKEHSFRLTSLPAELLTRISYAAVRRKDEEEGAVQRVLNGARIAGIKDFALRMGDFPAAIVLNWVDDDPIVERNGCIEIPDKPKAAQIIDGQHRVAGLRQAIEENPESGSYEIPVAIYEGLDTANSARIFISINTEQRPAPKSLVFDLYGVTGSDLMDPAAIRASDIITFISSDGQPYSSWIKLPNQERQRGGVALSTAVSTIKPIVEAKGILEQIGITELEVQKKVFCNYFKALQLRYGTKWNDRNNAFVYASGFIGAVDFFRTHMFDYCRTKGSFEVDTVAEALHLDEAGRILQEDVKGLGGTEAANRVHERLISAFRPAEEPKGFKV
ncbi:DNA sulfur modification protein DndB [Sphingomonas sp. SORGH_AS802]|uniref:DGQHR domain-containing protein n=1 Tax=unclassified Sphingomonas TaxID=196159 RepID=UPI0028663A49|nr:MULTISPECIES: DGQHR domain-containing protein [unclassified Sphingomonas]MDR6128822.1 DNA sulfur modification protein DndB [Sphingomonas sp. SORGH_AS_0438]MDR6136165.1 DNA sulfur modification protein DndB [Sphingomonas sp. SORGH_AS_0802]